MRKLLPTLGLVAGILGAAMPLIGNGIVLLLLPGLAALATAVAVMLQRDRSGWIVGGLLALFSLVAIVMSIPGGISSSSAATGSDSGNTAAWAATAGVVAALAILAVRRGEIQPNWAGYGAAVAGLVTVILCFVQGNKLGTVGSSNATLNYVATFTCLLAAVPNVLFLRAPAATMTQVMTEPAKAPDSSAAKPKPKAPSKK